MRRRRPFILISIAAFSALVAGCGGGGSPQASATTTATVSQAALLAFSRCMRSNGVPSFPDPQRYVGGSAKLTVSLEKGNYTLYCSVPGHEAAGMAAKLAVG